jgi:hypothetical protein
VKVLDKRNYQVLIVQSTVFCFIGILQIVFAYNFPVSEWMAIPARFVCSDGHLCNYIGGLIAYK